MKKKTLLITAGLTLALVGTLTLIGNETFIAKATLEHDYHITFDSNSLYSYTFREDYNYDFKVGSVLAIDDKYDLFSDENTVFTCYDKDAVTWTNEDDILQIKEAQPYFEMTIGFSFLNRASFDLANSRVTYKDASESYNQTIEFTDLGENVTIDGYHSYLATFDSFSYGMNFKLLQIDLYFSC